MKLLSRSTWRLSWVLMINVAVLILQLTAPIRSLQERKQLRQLGVSNSPESSYWKEISSDPWVPIMAAILMAGIVAEVRRSVVAPVFNVGPFTFWLILALRDAHYRFLAIPLGIIIAVTLAFYIPAVATHNER